MSDAARNFRESTLAAAEDAAKTIACVSYAPKIDFRDHTLRCGCGGRDWRRHASMTGVERLEVFACGNCGRMLILRMKGAAT